jgi:hypothetical protein
MNGLLPGSGSNKVRALQVVGLALLLAIIVALTYREAPGNEFHFDDHRNIVDYGPVRMEQPSGKALLDAFANPKLQYRNFPSLTFAVDWWRGGGEARAFLQTNVFLHVLTALAVFAFAYRLLCRLQTENRRTVLLAAFCVALLWAVHPINSQAVNLIVQRMAILATLFVLLSLTCYLEARRADSTRHIAWYAAAALFGVLGAFSKENAWILPLLVLAVEYGVVRHGQVLVQNKLDVLLLALPFVGLALVATDLALGSGPVSNSFLSGYETRSFSMEERLLTQPRVIFFYLSLILWPLPGRFSLEHDFAVSTSLHLHGAAALCPAANPAARFPLALARDDPCHRKFVHTARAGIRTQDVHADGRVGGVGRRGAARSMPSTAKICARFYRGVTGDRARSGSIDLATHETVARPADTERGRGEKSS